MNLKIFMELIDVDQIMIAHMEEHVVLGNGVKALKDNVDDYDYVHLQNNFNVKNDNIILNFNTIILLLKN